MIRPRPLWAALALAYMGMVLGLTTLPAREVARWGLSALLVNLAHVPLFAGLAWVTLYAFAGPPRARVLLTAGLCFAFALADEWIQSFVPGRVPALDDVLADGVGIAIGIAAGLWLRPIPSGWKGRLRE